MEELQFLQSEVLPSLLRGLKVSIALILPSAFFGVCIGVWAGATRVYGNRLFKTLANAYVALFRGTPLVVQLFFWYFGLPHVGIYLSPFVASVVGFSLCSGAYQSEYVRGALLSIKRGQLLAAQALGFTKWKMLKSIILPQALRRALPGCGNEIIYLIKYSSLAYMVTCIEMTGEAKILASHYFKYTEVFLTVGAFYLALVSLASWLLHRLEGHLSLPGFEHHRN
ncbi:amino acid ABC transporter permease [Desulforhabdus amnigena]|jgi:polar amino acid transport system permease protein|uniref:Amino acid ABC transporter permease n=1 Tax=Desulforhabdus amnigena TaxID=40218 RepID=A0A9W6D119_9BACT|nr:amino acid ABC transporter permease [Desulforhabdus amnigena]NLJ29824.1 amino acid ABC transporter permease [Deltaproteobacteria bacterium]GLI33900.1 amino acid ABC transporter permease [Desulforhabdus amnigena]